eukprot:TRINITY_DN3791_c0_g1_i1.p2 TRINITY_DN3791_c0_g1~~TRINITY_DN3791_c0_g1_i1.p2  ORF type:complete len:134 (+),score=62.36 TRINITY_DN3791_c0_g1_i1:902-1303(+)
MSTPNASAAAPKGQATPDAREIFRTHPLLDEIKEMTGVEKITLESYTSTNSSGQNFVIVITATPLFKEREKVPAYLDGVRLIMEYVSEATPEETEQVRAILALPDEEEGGEEGEEGGDSEEEREVEEKEEQKE